MKIAVTGATGFIGQYVVAELESRSISPIIVSRSLAMVPPSFAKHRIVLVDLLDPPANPFEVSGRPDAVIHLAWGGLPNYRSLHHFERELPAQYEFLKRLVQHGLRNLLVAGTCFEYGMQPGRLGEDLPARPDNPYGFAKNALRAQLEYLRREVPFNLTWARLFYMYGDGQSATSLWPQLKSAVERGAKMFDMSGGEQLRDYLHVGEAAKHLVSLALLAGDVGPVNVCSGAPISVRQLVERWIEEQGWSIQLNLGHYPYPDYEPMAFWGDRRLLNQRLENQ